MMNATNLTELYAALKSGRIELTDNLPVFADEYRDNPEYVWSWDESDEIRGTCVDDLKIVPRAT